jgi:formate-dependent nitrite reductase membrane component NrfD
MWLVKEAFGWVVIALFLTGVISLAFSYRVRRGRRENMLASSLRRGCVVGILTVALGLPIAVLVAWLAS